MVLIGGWGAYFEGAGGGISGYYRMYFFSGRWVYNCVAYKWEGGLYWGGGVLSDEFFFQAGGPITAGLISGRGALLEGGGGRLIIVCTFF